MHCGQQKQDKMVNPPQNDTAAGSGTSSYGVDMKHGLVIPTWQFSMSLQRFMAVLFMLLGFTTW